MKRLKRTFAGVLSLALTGQGIPGWAGVSGISQQSAEVPVKPVAIQTPLGRRDFFNQLDLHLTAINNLLTPLPGKPLGDAQIQALSLYVQQNLSAAAASPGALAAQQVLVEGMARPSFRPDVEGTLRWAANGTGDVQEQRVADGFAELAQWIETAEPDKRLPLLRSLAEVRRQLLGGVGKQEARELVGGHLDHLFDATPNLTEGAPVFAAPGKQKDEFGRTAGWEDIALAPPEAPKSMAEIDLSVPRPGGFHPSPKDWRDEVLYYVLLDRFARAEPYKTWGNPYDGRTRHGGNIRGLIEKLDYLKGMGVTTVVVSPIFMNPPGSYHGYSTIHLLAVDPYFGTMQDFKELVALAHQRGMRIVLDMVFNQTGPILKYKDGFKFGSPKEIERWRYPLKPVELAQPEHFARRGDIGDWSNLEQREHGDLPGGINKLATDRPATQDILIQWARWVIHETDIDGMRVDAVAHLIDQQYRPKQFLARLSSEIRQYARSLGKNDFLLMGELFDGDPEHYLPVLQGGNFVLYNYASYYWDDAALHGQAPVSKLAKSFTSLRRILGELVSSLVNFFSNHDRVHFLGPADPLGALRFAIAYTMTAMGVPYFYGDEQAPRRVPGRKWLDVEASREDRFRGGKFVNPGVLRGFDTGSPGYRWFSRLTQVRAAYPALRRGEMYVRFAEQQGTGIFAFSQIHQKQEVLVVLNNSDAPRSAQMWVDADLTPPGTQLVDALDPEVSVRSYSPAGGGSQVSVTVPPYGARIFVRAPGSTKDQPSR